MEKCEIVLEKAWAWEFNVNWVQVLGLSLKKIGDLGKLLCVKVVFISLK